ncbi:hypothetical protein BJX76DRAFT_353899 [Aspergillus varians]
MVERSPNISGDPFQHLPLELREQVAILLNTDDFFNLRYVSRAMATVFHNDQFWKSRFHANAERGFLVYSIRGDENPFPDERTDWRGLYHASSKTGKKIETTVKVWEVLRWIKDVIDAEDGVLQTRPLDFYGRALQSYHNTRAVGRRIETVNVASTLKMIGVSFISGTGIYEQSGLTARNHNDTVTEIIALEFIFNDGRRITTGTKNPGATILTFEGLTSLLEKYEDAKARRRYGRRRRGRYATTAANPYNGPGVHVLYDASDFRGFRFQYNAEGIYSLGIIQEGSDEWDNPPQLHGYIASDCPEFDIALDRVVTVVATFEGPKLMELGLRGFGFREPLYGPLPSLYGRDVDILRYGEKMRKIVELELLEEEVKEDEQELAEKCREVERLKKELERGGQLGPRY